MFCKHVNGELEHGIDVTVLFHSGQVYHSVSECFIESLHLLELVQRQQAAHHLLVGGAPTVRHWHRGGVRALLQWLLLLLHGFIQ